ncbi:hypothetical protein MYU51_000755 [Penicillium brevicompactum]
MTQESQESYCSAECVICDAIRLAYCRSPNYDPIAFVNESHYDDRVFDHNGWRRTDIMQSPAFSLGSVPNTLAVPEESYGYYRDYGTDTGFSRLQNDFPEPNFDLFLSVPPCTQGLQSLDLGHLDYTFDTRTNIDHSGFYTDGRSQTISFPFIPLPSGMLAYEDYGSLQVVGQSPISNPSLVDETLDITDSFDLQSYYYGMEASPLQTSHADETITSEETHEVIPSTLRRSQRLIERSRAV